MTVRIDFWKWIVLSMSFLMFTVLGAQLANWDMRMKQAALGEECVVREACMSWCANEIEEMTIAVAQAGE